MSDLEHLKTRHKDLIFDKARSLADIAFNTACSMGNGHFPGTFDDRVVRENFRAQLRSAIFAKLMDECDKARDDFLINYLRTTCEKLEKEHGTPQR